MKKIGVLFILSILLLSFINVVSAQIDPEDPLGIGIQREDIPETPEELRNQTISYLKQEWGKILEKNEYIGPIISGFRTAAPVLNPISQALFGLKPSLTWLYVLTIILWIVVVSFIYQGVELFSESGFIKLAIAIVIGMLISLTGAVEFVAKEIVDLIIFFWIRPWVQVVALVVVIIALIYVQILSKKVGARIKKARERAEAERTKFDRFILRTEAIIARAKARAGGRY